MTEPTRPTRDELVDFFEGVECWDLHEDSAPDFNVEKAADAILALFAPWADAQTQRIATLEQRLREVEGERDGLREEVEGLAQSLVDADRPYSEVRAERTRQELLRAAGKFLHTCASPDFVAFNHFGRVAVLGEEFGEVCRAVLDVEKIAEGRGDPDAARKKLRAELVQVAAVAVAYIEGLDGKEPAGDVDPRAQVADLARQLGKAREEARRWRDDLERWVLKVEMPSEAHLHYAECPYAPYAKLPSWETPEGAPECTCAKLHGAAYWKGQHLLERSRARLDQRAHVATIARLRGALEEISRGEGPFSLDPLEHAGNVIDAMKAVASAALSDVPTPPQAACYCCDANGCQDPERCRCSTQGSDVGQALADAAERVKPLVEREKRGERWPDLAARAEDVLGNRQVEPPPSQQVAEEREGQGHGGCETCGKCPRCDGPCEHAVPQAGAEEREE